MNDLKDRLRQFDQPPAAPGDGVIEADLRRGRNARRRRTFRAATAGLGVAAVAVIGGVVAVNGTGPSGDGPSAGSSSPGAQTPGTSRTPSGKDTAVSPKLRLVAYDGPQKPGFEVAKVPEGYVVQGADSIDLVVGLEGTKGQAGVYVDKLAVMLQSQDAHHCPRGEPVKVGAYDGWLDDSGRGARVLTYLTVEHTVLVQVWETIPLTNEQIVEFAEGVTVTEDVRAGIG